MRAALFFYYKLMQLSLETPQTPETRRESHLRHKNMASGETCVGQTEAGLLGAVAAIVLFALLLVFGYFAGRVLKLRRRQRVVQQQRLDESLLMTRSLFFSSATVKAADFLQAGRLTAHEALRDRGLLRFRDTLEDLADDDERFVFFSHQ